MQPVRLEFDVLLDAAEDGRLGQFQMKRNDFIQEFADFFGEDVSRLLDKGRMERPRELRPEDLNVPSRLRWLATKAFNDINGVHNSLNLVKDYPATYFGRGDEELAARLRMIAGDLQKILQPIDQLYRISAVAQESLDEDDVVGATSLLRPDASGERGGNPASSRTLSRAPVFPYDRPISYGNQYYLDASGPSDSHAMTNVPKTAWESLGEELELEDPSGMGEGGVDAVGLELDAVKRDFRDALFGTVSPPNPTDTRSLYALLHHVDPDYATDLFAPEDDSEMMGIYMDWADRVAGPEGTR